MAVKFDEPTIWVSTRDGWLNIYTPYNEDFVARIKIIDPNDRKWDANAKCWRVVPMLRTYVEQIILATYGVPPVYLDEPPFPGPKPKSRTYAGGYYQSNNTNSNYQPPPPPKAPPSTSWVKALYAELPIDARDSVLRALTKAFHPDVNPSGEERMKEITQVFRG